jgi:hypothetical protein
MSTKTHQTQNTQNKQNKQTQPKKQPPVQSDYLEDVLNMHLMLHFQVDVIGDDGYTKIEK